MNVKTTKLVRVLLLAILVGGFGSGCAQYSVMRQPRPFSPTCLKPGAKRVDVIAELGQPFNTQAQGNRLTDNFKYVDGGSKNNGFCKTGRVVLYSTGDIFTCFFDQLALMPFEDFVISGTNHLIVIEYSKSNYDDWRIITIADTISKSGPYWRRQF